MIRERMLDRLYPHIVSCRASVEMAHRRHAKGNVPSAWATNQA